MSRTLAYLAVAAGLLAVSVAGGATNFDEWTALHSKTYATADEREYRASIWSKNLEGVLAHNAGDSLHKREMTAYADLTNEEWASLKSCASSGSEAPAPVPHLRGTKNGIETVGEVDDDQDGGNSTGRMLQSSVDWVTAGYVNPSVAATGCISGYAQAVTGACEAAMKAKYNFLPQASMQEIIDCTSSYGNQGCYGGWPSYTFNYVASFGLASASDYSYYASTGTCRNYLYGRGLYIDSWTSTSSSDSALATSVASRPTIVPINTVTDDIRYYSSGYGTDNSVPYFTVRLDNGPTWGESGTVRILRDSSLTYGVCGIYGSRAHAVKN